MSAILLLAAAILLVRPRPAARTPAPTAPAALTAPPVVRRALPVVPLAAGVAGAALVLTLLGVPQGVLAGPPVGVGVAVAAGVVLRRAGGRVAAEPPAPLALDLVAAGLRAGATTVDALRSCVAGPSMPAAERTWTQTAAVLGRVAALLSLGAAPAEAWAAVPPQEAWRTVAGTAVRSADSGLRLASGFERLAGDLRAERRTAEVARTQRTAVFVLLPLGLCFLPAFVCLGVVPVVAGVAGQVFGP